MSFIGQAVLNWSKTLNEIIKILYLSPEEWNGSVWKVITGIHSSLAGVASALLVLIFFIGFAKKEMDLREFRKIENIISVFIRFVVAFLLTTQSMNLMVWIFEILQGVMSVIGGNGIGNMNLVLPTEIDKAVDDISLLDPKSLLVGIVGLLLMLLIWICGIVLIIIVWGRFANLYIHFAVSGLFLAAFAAESTSQVSISFIKSFINALFQGVIILLALIIYSAIITTTGDSSEAIEAVKNGEALTGIMLYAKQFSIGAALMLVICKSGDHMAQKMGL